MKYVYFVALVSVDDMDQKLENQLDAAQEANDVAIEEAENEIKTSQDDIKTIINKQGQEGVGGMQSVPHSKKSKVNESVMIDFTFDGEIFSFEKHPSVLMDVAPMVKLAYDARHGCKLSEAILYGIKVEIKLKDGRYYWPPQK